MLIEAVNQIGVPLYQAHKLDQIRTTERDLYTFARRIVFWAQMGARPSIVGVEDPLFSTRPTRTRGFEEVMDGLREKKWDAVAIESPGLSDRDVFIIGVFLSQQIRNYDEYFELFEASSQDAVRWRGQPWEASTWEIKVGHYETSGINQVEEEWEKHERLTELSAPWSRAGSRTPGNTWTCPGAVSRRARPTSPGSGPSATRSFHALAPLPRAAQGPVEATMTRASDPERQPRSTPEDVHRAQRHVEYPPVFFVHETDGDYLEVSGADFNTYTAIRPMWTEGRSSACRTTRSSASRTRRRRPVARPGPGAHHRARPAARPPSPTRIEQRLYFPFSGKDPRTDANYDSTPVLDQVAEHWATPLAKVKIVGYTDDVGEAPFNEKLSLDRANAVKELLESRGIAADRLSVEGFGKGAPIATNTTEDGRARNRRVECVPVP